jgi:hypothetical protein
LVSLKYRLLLLLLYIPFEELGCLVTTCHVLLSLLLVGS